MADKIKFGYWGIRGLAQVARLLLAYTGLQWEDVVYADRDQWLQNDKVNLGLDFPNLPYLIDGDFKLTQSKAIERYIIQKAGNNQLLGKDLQDSARVNQILGVIGDIRTPLLPLFFDKDWEAKSKQVLEKIKGKVELINKHAQNKEWVSGYLTISDFYIAELSYFLEKLFPEEYKSWGEWQRIRDSFNNLEVIKNYYNSESAIKGPFLPPHHAVIQL